MYEKLQQVSQYLLFSFFPFFNSVTVEGVEV